MTKKEQEEKFEQLVSKAREILLRKGDDYANTDRLSNFKFAGQICNISPSQQCLSLIAVKVARLGNLLSQTTEPKNESIQDSIEDLFNYAALLYMIQTEDK